LSRDRHRPPAVAGTFYPDDPARLGREVDGFVAAATVDGGRPPKAIIAPHAGYVYSGPIAGTAYAAVAALSGQVSRIVLAGPAHRVPLDGLAVSAADAFDSPLGAVPVDDEARRRLLALPRVVMDDRPHAPEHSLEVHLPFLQLLFGGFTLVPLVVGRATADEVAEAFDVVWGGDETLVVVSSDLSHYHPYETAVELDRRTAGSIVGRDHAAIGPLDACGAIPIKGLLVAAERHGLDVRLLDLRNSGDTAGSRDRVVGYGAFTVG
jgi:AmmeMemoRadiSam system protein B